MLDCKIEAVVISLVLVSATRAGIVDDVELSVVGIARFDSGELKQLEAHALEQPLFAAMVEADLLDDG